jgi:hypothetical protein
MRCAFPLRKGKAQMMKISIVDGRNQRRLVLEGKLVAPWVAELKPACERAKAGLGDRELVVELKNLIAINQAGENVLLELMQEGVKFRGCGVFTRHMLRQVARRVDGNHKEIRR